MQLSLAKNVQMSPQSTPHDAPAENVEHQVLPPTFLRCKEVMCTIPSAPLCCFQLSCLQGNSFMIEFLNVFFAFVQCPTCLYSVWKKAPAFMASSTRVSRRVAATTNSSSDEHLSTLPRHLYSPAHHMKNHRVDPDSVYSPPLNCAFISECMGKVAFHAIIMFCTIIVSFETNILFPTRFLQTVFAWKFSNSIAVSPSGDSSARAASGACHPNTVSNTVLLNICRAFAPITQNYAANLMSNRATSCAKGNRSSCSATKIQTPQSNTPRGDVDRDASHRQQQQSIPLHSSPSVRPQREHSQPAVSMFSLSEISLQHRPIPFVTSNDLPKPTLIQGRGISIQSDSINKTLKSVDTFLCKQPDLINPDSEGSALSENPKIISTDNENPEIGVIGTSLVNTCASPVVWNTPTLGSLRTSKIVSDQMFASSHVKPKTLQFLSVPSLNVTALLNVEAQAATSSIAHSDEVVQASPHKLVNSIASNSNNLSSFSVIGKKHSAFLPEADEEVCMTSPLSTLNPDTLKVSDHHSQTSDFSLSVPVCTPRMQSDSSTIILDFQTSFKPNAEAEQNIAGISADGHLISKSVIGGEGFLDSQTPPQSFMSRSKLLLQSSNCLHPTLMSSNVNQVSAAIIAQPDLPKIADVSVASLPWFVKDTSSTTFLHATHGACYVKRQSEISLTSGKASLQNLPKKTSASSPNEQVVVILPHAAINSYSQDIDCNHVVNSSCQMVSTQVPPQSALETPLVHTTQSNPNHLTLLASSRVRSLLDAQLPKDTIAEQSPNHRAALIIPKSQSLLARLRRDSAKFTEHTMPLHIKGQQRNERRHQRVILGADALRAQKLDI
jgi:hypothetical protein